MAGALVVSFIQRIFELLHRHAFLAAEAIYGGIHRRIYPALITHKS